MKVALVGLMQSGKSTILSAVSGRPIKQAGAVAIEEAIVPVSDKRLDWMTGFYKAPKTIYATIDCLDVPGFNFTDEHGRAVARRMINKIRTVELLVLVIRAFENPGVPTYRGRIDPLRDLAELKTELLLADLELVTTRIEKLEKQVHKPTKTQAHDKVELALQKKLQQAIEAERPISSAIETETEREMIKSFGFLTLKPIVIVVNITENRLAENFDFSNVIEPIVPIVTICAGLEYELTQLDTESRREFMTELGISESAISKFVNSCYKALGLISFLTHGSDEVRAWPIRQGTVAVEAAGKVHSDIKRGFIRAETIAFVDMEEFGSEKAVKAAGKVRLEGKEYVIKDGDIINFRFNV